VPLRSHLLPQKSPPIDINQRPIDELRLIADQKRDGGRYLIRLAFLPSGVSLRYDSIRCGVVNSS